MPSASKWPEWIAGAMACGWPLVASAQERASEIVVTGERQARTRDQTASSVTVFGAADLAATPEVDQVDKLLAAVPNVQLGSGGEGPTIRGQDTTGVLRDLPAFLGGNRPRTTLQVDGRVVTYNEFAYGAAQLWDVARVEVFRTPQSTTQGRNSIAGAIFVQTEEPTFTWQARGRATAGSQDLTQVSAVVSGPLVKDELAVRLSGDARRAISSSRLTSSAIGVDPNRADYWQVRLKLLARPHALGGFSLSAVGAINRSQSPQIEGLRAPFRARSDPLATYGIFKTDVTSLTVRAEQVVADTLKLAATGSLGDSLVRRFAPVGFGETHIDGADRSLELTVDWHPRDRTTLLAGLHVARNDLDQAIDLAAARLGLGEFGDRQTSFGVFGEATAEPAARVELALGGRYQRDRQVRAGKLTIGTHVSPLAYDRTFEAFLPKASLAYRFGKDSRVGLLVQRAYNPGGTTLNLGTLDPDNFEAERMWDFELFARAALFDRRLHVAANLFEYRIEDAQRSLLRELATPGGTVYFAEIANAPEAWTRGAEVELQWRGSHRLSVSAGLGLLGTRLTRTLSATDPLVGKDFQRSPHLTASAAATWRPLTTMTLSAQLRHHSAYFSEDTNDPARRVPPGTTVDARAQYDVGAIRLFGYVRNVFDSFNLTYLFAPSSRLATADEPRQFGAGVEARF